MAPSPAVIVPTFNGVRRLPLLLDSLRRQTLPGEVVVVDNGSRDDTAAVVAARFPEVSVVSLGSNHGFGRAINRGAATASSPILVLLNDDAVCEPEFLDAICGALDPARGVTMAAGVLVAWDDPQRVDTAGIVFDETLFAVDYLHGAPVSALAGAADPLGPSGGAAAFDRASFLRAGGFDEAYFAYLEDVDLVARLLAAGERCSLAAAARARHRHSATLGPGTRRKNALMAWSRGYTIAKYRLHRQPSALARMLVMEGAIVAGQAVVDRTLVGATRRVAGFRAGLRADPHSVPPLPEVARTVSASRALRTRLARRRARSWNAPQRPRT